MPKLSRQSIISAFVTSPAEIFYMIRILANDGIHPAGKDKLEAAGYEVVTQRVAQDQLPSELPNYAAICVRSATKVRKDLIDACPNLKAIGRGGVGLDNIDVKYAEGKGIKVMNTPAASSRAVAELAFGHVFSLARFLHRANAEMGAGGDFKSLKKEYAKGIQLEGLTLGVIGLGRIGREAARIGLGLGMRVVGSDPYVKQADVELNIQGLEQQPKVIIKRIALEELLAQADVITLHVPSQDGEAIIGPEQLRQVKQGAILVNTARGGLIDEAALLKALDEGRIAGVGLDVYDNEPTPNPQLLQHPRISVSPHIGAATGEAQKLIGVELADQLIEVLG